MEPWVIFLLWLLSNQLMNGAETFTNISFRSQILHKFLQTNATKVVTCML